MSSPRSARRGLGLPLTVLLVLSMLPGLQGARAQPQALPPEESNRLFQVFLVSPQFRTYLTEQLVKTEPPASLAECNRLAARLDLDAHRVQIDAPVVMAKGSSVPVSGMWRHQIPADRCGTMVRRTLLVQATGNGQLRALQLLPGETIANVQLQIDTLRAALLQVAARTGCKDAIRVTDTKVEQPYDAGRWSELWSFNACGAATQRVIQFAPPPTGPGTVYTVGDDPARPPGAAAPAVKAPQPPAPAASPAAKAPQPPAPAASPAAKAPQPPAPTAPARAKPAPAAPKPAPPKEDATR